ncbi:pseudouridine-metabolizing bifunctional protein C1861.05 [Coccinella septempunctata]|uniref:pseudouridine-metabolizing bifunctional protein C1861.05 n=1 Tax=Coccinella septempunctata TaxID=41139 RepID=UPI001D080F7A|nr:pseudouridine-metabolizing bifunctional protein C1861.05 [Coccinella septempunctata]
MQVATRSFNSRLKNFRFISNLSVSEKLLRSGVLSIKDEVRRALQRNDPIVALESTIITHGLPYPDNVKCAMDVENEIRQKGAIPATISILDGVIKAGLEYEEMEYIGNVEKSSPVKTSRRDFPYVLSKNLNGGTTVSGTLIVADALGISVFATGGIGGVHREGETTFDISADLTELGKSQVAVVSSGVKSILDIPKTLEYLETQGVFVATYGTNQEFPAFYSRRSGSMAPYRVSNPNEAAKIILSSKIMNLHSGMLFAVPVPEEQAFDEEEIHKVIQEALEEAKKKEIRGKQITPYLLRKIWEMTQGKSLHTNIALIRNNARVAAEIAVQLKNLENGADSQIGRKDNPDGIVVIGGSNLDLCAKLQQDQIKLDGRMHPSKLSYVAGGVARNICEALTKMGSTPTFITAIGDDKAGELLTSMMPKQMKDKSHVLRGKNTAQCVIVLDSKGDCSHLLADFDIHNEITPEIIHKNEDIIRRAKLIVLDANISVESMGTILKYATEHKIPVFFEPTDVIVAAKPFETDFWKAVKIITPNINELYFIGSYLKILPSERECGSESIEDIARLAKKVASFVENVIVTLGTNGVLIARKASACDTFLTKPQNGNIEIRHYPAEIVKNVVNVSGAGDCLASGLILSTLRGLPEEKCVSVGFSAAKKALKSSTAVGDDMFVENLEDWEDCAKYYVVETEITELNKMPHT